MRRILVIADDLSGAAEIASVAVRYALPARVHREAPTTLEAGVTVIDTDTRRLPRDAVATVLRQMTRNLAATEFDFVYKKTDSVFRGHILAELETLMPIFNHPAAILLPQNPSRQRTICDGVYRIEGVPLDQTLFAHDPEHPARSANLLDLLGPSPQQVRCCACDEFSPAAGVTIGAAANVDDVRRWTQLIKHDILPAGGADFFQALLQTRGYVMQPVSCLSFRPGTTLFACGSTSANRDAVIARAQRERIPVCAMTGSLSAWSDDVIRALDATGRALMVIPKPIDRSPGAPQRLQDALAEAVKHVLNARSVTNLLLEGGAIAAAVCRAMNWHHFSIEGELSPGVTVTRCDAGAATAIVIKPGSYAWPDAVFANYGAR
jgi:uncharacterized protein YgbK (DUF1537 family)